MVEHQLPKLDTGVRFPSLAVRIFDTCIMILCFAYLTFNLLGCATAPHQQPIPGIPKLVGGIYHEVQKGDTLWRIAKTYDIDLSYLVKINNISDETKISPGENLFIPGAKTPLLVTSGKTRLYKKDDFIWPVQGEVISFFGEKVYGAKNKGIDISAGRGNKIFASKKGRVVFCSDRFRGHGNIIIIDHLDGFLTVYTRTLQNLVKTGDPVEQDRAIALAGSTGRGKAAYLHFEIRKRGKPQNPLYYLP